MKQEHLKKIMPSKDTLYKIGFAVMILLQAAMILSCGSSGGANAGAETNAKANTPVTSYYVDSASDLMPCVNSAKHFLVYVKESDQFMACDGTNWNTVNVKGKDGKDGIAGAQGASGSAGAPVASNMWYDAVSGKSWLIPSLALDFSTSQCSGNGYRIPSAAELVTAIQRGLLAKTTTQFAWADNGASNYCIQTTCLNGSIHAGDKDPNGASAGHYCVSP
jgi:hypothetical protein